MRLPTISEAVRNRLLSTGALLERWKHDLKGEQQQKLATAAALSELQMLKLTLAEANELEAQEINQRIELWQRLLAKAGPR